MSLTRRGGPFRPGAAWACLALCACAHTGPAAPPTSPPKPETGRFHFVDVAASAGLTRVTWAGRPGKDHLLDSAGTGAAFLDYDRDGRLDVYVVNGWRLEEPAPGGAGPAKARVIERGRHALYRGMPDGTFRDVTEAAGVAGEGLWGSGVAVADYDADGWPDLLVTGLGPNILYRNKGNGTFENVAPRLGIEAPGWNTGAAFLDAEGDGDLDLYVASYIVVTMDEVLAARPTLDWKGLEKVAFGPFGLTGAPDHYFRSEGGRRFIDATAAAGLLDKGRAFGFAVRAADFDDDGDLDLYVANDSDPNYLYRNEGDGTFKEVGVWSGCALDANGAAQASMGVAVGDATGDGVLDLVTTNFSEDFSTFYRGLGGGSFEDASEETGVGPATFLPMSWGTAFADFDNDGDLDLVVANGHIYPQIDRHPEVLGTFRQRTLLLENRAGRFVDVTAQAGPGFQELESSRGLAVGDYDNDGDVDILITHLDAPPSLLRNESRGEGSWLEVACEVPGGTAIPTGATVTVTAGGRTQRRDIASGDSYMSSHDPRPHFGLGDASAAQTIDVRWPDGSHTVRHDEAARRLVTIRKGS